MRRREYFYRTSCVSSTAQLIGDMTDRAVESSYRAVRHHCDGLDEWAASMGYDIGNQRGSLRLKDDWAVSFHKSVYDGKPCYYIRYSSIEHIWTKE